MNKKTTGSSLARISVEVGEVEDIKLIAKVGGVNWNAASQKEDAAIMWALKNGKLDMVLTLLNVPGVDLEVRDKDNLTLAKIAR